MDQVFYDNVFKLYGLPRSIVSHRDKIFTNLFWKELFHLGGVHLKMSSAYHLQSDGQIKVTNRCLENYLHCFVGDKPHTWSSWLPLAEYWHNTNHHIATGFSPYQALYGVPPPRL